MSRGERYALAFTLIPLLLIGCSTPYFVTTPPKQHPAQLELLEQPSPQVPRPPESVEIPLIPIWVPCEEDEEPATVFVAELTIPKLFEPRVFRFPLCLKPEPFGQYYDPMSSTELADGVSPKGCGMGYGGSLDIDSIEGDEITVEVSYYWKDIDCERGEIDSSFVAHFGKREEFVLSPTVRVKTSFTSSVPKDPGE